MEGGDPGDRDGLIVEAVLAGATLEQVAGRFRLTKQRVSQIVRARCPGWDGRGRRRAAGPQVADVRDCGDGPCGRQRVWSDEMVLAALRGAAGGGSLSARAWREGRFSPSITVVVARFGSWSAACRAAGLEVGTVGVPDRELLAMVAEYLAAGGNSARGYTVWAGDRGAAGLSVLRRRFGSWSMVKRLAAPPPV